MRKLQAAADLVQDLLKLGSQCSDTAIGPVKLPQIGFDQFDQLQRVLEAWAGRFVTAH
jgi:hypothetical protein